MKESEMREQILDMIKDFMLGEHGKKFQPKHVEVEVMSGPEEMEDKGGLADMLKQASEERDEPSMDDEDCEEMPMKSKSPREFFKRK